MGFEDWLGEAWGTGKRALGETVDGAAHVAGAGLDMAGLHGAAKSVDGWGDSAADSLGVDIAEKELGDTDDPKDLIHGNPAAIREAAGHLSHFQAAFESTGSGLRRLDHDHWQGDAADAFRAKFTPHPKEWLTAADACGKAAEALETYAQTVEWAQGQAKQCLDQYTKAGDAYQRAQAAYNKQVDAYNAQVDAYNQAVAAGRDPGTVPTKPGKFDGDQYAADMALAEMNLHQARVQRDSAARTAGQAIEAVTDTAPKEPSFASRLLADGEDALAVYSLTQGHVVGGVVKGAADLVKFARGLNPMDPYNVTHPAMWLDHVSTTAAGLLHASNHPTELLSALVGSGWSSDPGEAMGKFITNVAAGVLTDGGSAGGSVAEREAVGVAENAARDEGVNAAERGAENSARRAVDEPEVNGRTEESRTDCGDPVDVATGHVTLTQTDVALPGSLPLLFTRRHDSSHRHGRWMGPSWTCTADERLEIDAEGVVHVGADGILLAYPHPVPGLPTLPATGPRRPLALAPDGTYTVTDPDTGHMRTFAPEPDDPALAQLTEIRDRAGRWIALDHDDAGTPVWLRHSSGRRMRIDVDGNHITALHLANAGPDGGDLELVRFGYADGHLTDVTDSSGLPQRFAYDDEGRMLSWTDRNGSGYAYRYDHLNRCVEQGGQEGHLAYRYDYDATDPQTGHRITAVTDSLGHTSRYVVNAARQIVTHIDPLGAATHYVRDRHDRLLSRTDPLDRTTAFEYDESGNPITVALPDGAQTLVAYNDLGLPVTVVEADGATWRRAYDQHGNPTRLTDPSGAVTQYAYDEQGHVAAVTDPLGHTTCVRCDAAGLPVETTDPLGATTRIERDAFGRPVAVTDPLGAVTRMTWTIEGRLATRTGPDGATETWEYDGEGNEVLYTDPLGAVTRSEYTHFDLLAARTGPDGTRHTFTHDTELRLTTVTNPQGLTWTYKYDEAGRLRSETDFDDRTLTYTHDAAGQLTARANALGQTIAFTRDALGTVTSKDAAGHLTSYTYDPAGRLLTATSSTADLARTYDRLGRLTAETVNGRTLTVTRDALGLPAERRTPSGAVSMWTYDAAGNPTALIASGHEVAFEHDQAGRQTHRHLGAGLTLAYAWDQAGRLTTQSLTRTEVLHRTAYTYRADGNLTRIDDQHTGTRRFDLDAASRVTAVHAAGWTERYAYDDAGNITDATWPDRSQEAVGPRTYTGTRIRKAGAVRYEHDAQGRITLRQQTRLSRKPDTWRYTWDAEDRLTAVTTPDGHTWRYRYDPLGRRIAKQRLADDGETVAEWTDFTWDGATLVEQTAHSPHLPGPYTLTWDHDGLHPIAQTERILPGASLPDDADQAEIDRRFFAIITDLVGTPTHLIDHTGATAWQATSTLWGTTTWPTGNTTYTPLRFPGQYYDPETRLHYNVHRYYDPATGRYASPDPLGLEGGPNPSWYVPNPTGWVDPLGLSLCRAKTPDQVSLAEQREVEIVGPGEVKIGDVHGDVIVRGGTLQGDVHGSLLIVEGGTVIGNDFRGMVVQIGHHNVIGEMGPPGANSLIGTNVDGPVFHDMVVQAGRVGEIISQGRKIWPLE